MIRVHLFNTERFHRWYALPPHENLGLATIDKYLDETRLRKQFSVSYFPAKRTTGNEGADALHEYLSTLDTNETHVFGLTATSSSVEFVKHVAKDIKRYVPTSLIVCGGVHFATETAKSKRDYQELLEESYIDVLNIGHCHPFVEFLEGVIEGRLQLRQKNGKMHIFGDVPVGVRYLNEEGVYQGNGRGTFPRIKGDAPVVVHDNVISAMLSNRCPNACDYCSSSLGQTNFSYRSEQLVNSIIEAVKDYDIKAIDLEDNNPTCVSNRKKTAQLLRLLRESGISQPISIFLDPIEFIDPASRYEIIQLVREYNIRKFYIGCDVVGANTIGRKYNGKVRDKTMLLKEKEGLSYFLKYLGKLGKPYGVILSYIFSPFDNKESIGMEIREIIRFYMMMRNLGIDGIINYYSLMPEINTRIRERSEGLFIPPEKLIFGLETNCWGYDEKLPASSFLDYLTTAVIKVHEFDKDQRKDFFENLIEILFLPAVYDLAFNRYNPQTWRLMEDAVSVSFPERSKRIKELHETVLKKRLDVPTDKNKAELLKHKIVLINDGDIRDAECLAGAYLMDLKRKREYLNQ